MLDTRRTEKKMIITVTMNPCIDRTVTIEQFRYGGMNRIQTSREDASGKGINVAIVYKELGGEALCTGINYLERGNLIRGRLNGLGIRHDFIEVPGTVRMNLKIFDKAKEIITEVNEPGAQVVPSALEDFKYALAGLTSMAEMVILSGSVPLGVPTTIYKDIMEMGCNIKWVLDAEGALFAEGLKGQPYLIKPNLFELEKALNCTLKDHKDIVRGARSLFSYGITMACVSMGAEGAIMVNEKEAYYAPPLPIEVKSTVGAGDSMVAAFCLALEEGADLKEVLRRGSAAAAATVVNEGTQLCNRNTYDFLLPQVNIINLRL